MFCYFLLFFANEKDWTISSQQQIHFLWTTKDWPCIVMVICGNRIWHVHLVILQLIACVPQTPDISWFSLCFSYGCNSKYPVAFLLSCHLVWHSLILAAQTRIRGMFVQEETLTNAGFVVTHMFDSIWPCSVSPCAIPALYEAAQNICLMAMAQNISKPLRPSSWTGKSTEQLRDHRHFFWAIRLYIFAQSECKATCDWSRAAEPSRASWGWHFFHLGSEFTERPNFSAWLHRVRSTLNQ